SHNGTNETPQRFVKQITECLSGYNEDPKNHLKLFDNDKDGYKDLISVLNISFSSVCEHHLLPFFGYIDIAYLPSDKILGLSKFARIIDVFSKRLQVQERLTKQLADFLSENLKSNLVMVNVRAQHTCMVIRGVNRPQSFTETFSVIGNEKNYQHFINKFRNSI